MTDDKTPAEGQEVLRQAPELNEQIDGEVTPVAVAPDDGLFEEQTPVVASSPADLRAGDTTDPMVQRLADPTGLDQVRLPRTGLEELDTALSDLEGALGRLSSQDRRLLSVLAMCFISLFMPWFQVQNHGAMLPSSPVSGVELVGLSSTVLIVGVFVIVLVPSALGGAVGGYHRVIVRVLTAALLLRFVMALASEPAGTIPWSYSFWVVVPGGLSATLALGILGRIPGFPRRPLSPT
jgi:hypothetical protein